MIRYWPVPSVTAVRTFSMSTSLAASTVTPGITPPDESLTTPVIDDDCANAAAGKRMNAVTSAIFKDLRISSPSSRRFSRSQNELGASSKQLAIAVREDLRQLGGGCQSLSVWRTYRKR